MRLIAFALFAMLAAPPANALRETAPERFSGIYDFYLGGLKAAELSVDVKFNPNGYRAKSSLITAGAVGLLYKAGFQAETVGRYVGPALQPKTFRAETTSRKKDQMVEVHYRGSEPTDVLAEPAFTPKPYEIDPGDQGGTLDPVSGALMAFAPGPVAEVCNRTVEVYDGRRRYALDLFEAERDGDRIRCGALYRRVAGFKPKMMEEHPEFPMTAWFEERADGRAHLVRLRGDSIFGVAVMLLRE